VKEPAVPLERRLDELVTNYYIFMEHISYSGAISRFRLLEPIAAALFPASQLVFT
jgi:hypothetical protein